MNEEWKSVVGYEGTYDVSNAGRIRRTRSANEMTAVRMRKPYLERQGYLRIALWLGNKKRTFNVHRIVLSAFVGPCQDGMQTNHIDGDKTNNRIDNLEYVTPSENRRHAFRTGLQTPMRGSKNPLAKLTEEDVRAIRKLIGKKSLASIGRMFGVAKSTVGCISNGSRWGWL